MRHNRRICAFIAAVAVAFGALWPLVSQAHFGPKPIPSFICAQTGFHPDAPLPHEDRNHCPLCAVGADFTPPTFAPPASAAAVVVERIAIEGESAPHPGFLARPPPSRAPPVHS